MSSLKKLLMSIPLLLSLMACNGSENKVHSLSINKSITTSSPLHGLSIGGPFHVRLLQGHTQQINVSGPQWLIEKLSVKEENGILCLNLNNLNNINNKEPIELDAVLPKIKQLQIAGAGTYEASGIESDKLKLEIAGAYTVKLNGIVRQLIIKQAGASSLDTSSLKAENVSLENAGVGSSNIFASDELHMRLAGIGHITYYGHPKTIQQEGFTLGGVNAGA